MASGSVRSANWSSLILHEVHPTENEIGVGAYGRIFEVDYEGTLCAAKEVHALLLQYAQGDDVLQKIKDDFLSECQIWSTLRHPCVVQFLGVYYPAMDQYRLPVMVMEKMQHSLKGLVEKYDNIPLNVKLSILNEVCLGLRYLHSRNPPIVHRDLTPNNILLSYRLEAKISDLGVAKVMKSNNQKTMTKLPGTPDFMPPEALSIRPVYGPSLDVFSYGGVILNVTTQLWPQPTDRNQLNPNTEVWEVVSEVKRRQEYLDKMIGGAADLRPLVVSCLDDNPKNRPPVAEISMTIKRVKDVCSEKSSHDGISPIVWWAEVSNEQQSQKMDKLHRLQDLYLTGVKPNGKDIGVGAYGRVFEVEYCGSVFAAKEVHSILLQGVGQEDFEAARQSFLTECIRSSSLGHPNIVTFLGVYIPSGHSVLPVLVMERLQGSLTSVVEKYPNIPMYKKLSVLLDVSRGLWYLHMHHPPIIHRDLSPNNVLLTSQFVAKISDLGVAKVLRAEGKKSNTRAPGTVDFMPPEALLEVPQYGPPLDIFSYGGLILHVVNQKWPKPLHYIITDPNTGKMVAISEVERRWQHLEMKGVPTDLQLLAKQCLDNQPSKRPPISDVSERINRMKETESLRCPPDSMSSPAWLQETTQMLEETTITTPTAKVRQSSMLRKKLKWEELAPLPVGRSGHTAVLLDGNIYVGGGSEGKSVDVKKSSYRLDVYNLTTNQWSPSPLSTPYRHFAMAVLDKKLITAGGATKGGEVVDKVLVLNAGQWTECNEMPTAKFNSTAVGYHSMLIVVGGTIKVDGKLTKVATTELLDTANGYWYTCNSLPSPHKQLVPAIMNDTLYLLGGFYGDGKPSPQVFVASLDTLTTHQLNWQSAPNTPWCGSPVVQYDKFLLTVGGIKQQSRASEVCIFIPSTGEWQQFGNIPAARSGPAVVGVVDSIIVIGGLTNKNNEYSNSVWIGVFK